MNVYPLIMAPSFRHGPETPWGGHALKELFGKNAPDEITGESLEVSALPGHESRIANGEYAGKTLRDLLPLWGKQLTGVDGNGFPLLLKLLDTRQSLSVQVHPDDSYAFSHEGKPGKSEAWYILDAAPGAELVYGIDTRGRSLRSVLDAGRLESSLCRTEVHTGDVFYIPAGTVHALGSGIRCYEPAGFPGKPEKPKNCPAAGERGGTPIRTASCLRTTWTAGFPCRRAKCSS